MVIIWTHSERFLAKILIETIFKSIINQHELNGGVAQGQPIVNTPKEAIETFMSTNIDCLVISDFILEKKKINL